MGRPAVLVTVALVLAAVAAVPLGGLATAGPDVGAQQPTDDGSVTATAPAPGERLSGVLDVGEAELESEVDSRAFGIEVAQAASADAKAEVVSERLAAVEERLDALEARKAALERARENGSLSEGAYAARIAGLAAELEGAERLANQSADVATGLPADLLASRGVDVESIRTLRDRASELGGGDVAEIARNIAGPDVGAAPGRAGPDDRGPDERGPGAQTGTPDRDDTGRNDSEGSPPKDVPVNGTASDPPGTDRGS